MPNGVLTPQLIAYETLIHLEHGLENRRIALAEDCLCRHHVTTELIPDVATLYDSLDAVSMKHLQSAVGKVLDMIRDIPLTQPIGFPTFIHCPDSTDMAYFCKFANGPSLMISRQGDDPIMLTVHWGILGS